MSESPVPEEIADKAIEWFVRLRADDVSQGERDLFYLWLQQARENQRAFVETLLLWEDLSVVKEMNFDELRSFPQIWDLKRRLEEGVAG